MKNNITIISAQWIIPVIPSNSVLENHALIIENGVISDCCSLQKALKKHPDAHHIHQSTHALIPGLINTHTHAAMSLFRGMADDISLMDWLNNHIWPAEAKWIDPKFIKDGAELAIAEMLLSGTSCFSDMYFFPDVVAKTAHKMGIHAAVGMIILDFPTAWANGPDEYFEKGLAVHDETRSLSRITTTLAPHAPYTVSDAPLSKVCTYADELNVPIHMHIHETAQEVNDAVAANGQRPLARLDKLGLLNPRMVAVHMTQLLDDEIILLAKQGVNVVHCPNSNAKLASGQCRVADLIKAGVNVSLGTDSAASNNNLDMLAEMRSAALFSKQATSNAESLPAWQVLEMATINGAKALNKSNEIGSLSVGKSADIVAIDLNHISTQPVYDPISQIVYSATREQVSDVWVGGNHLVKNHALQNIDVGELLSKTTAWGSKIKQYAIQQTSE